MQYLFIITSTHFIVGALLFRSSMPLYICKELHRKSLYLFNEFNWFAAEGAATATTFSKSRPNTDPPFQPPPSPPLAPQKEPTRELVRCLRAHCIAYYVMTWKLFMPLSGFQNPLLSLICSTFLVHPLCCRDPSVRMGNKKAAVQRFIPMPRTLLKTQQAFTRCYYLNILKDFLSI